MALSTSRSTLGCQGRARQALETRSDRRRSLKYDIGVAPSDVGVAGFEHRRTRDLANADRTKAVEAAGEGASEIRGHVLGDDDGPGKADGKAPSSASSAGGPRLRFRLSHSVSGRSGGRFAAVTTALARWPLAPMRC